MGQITQGLAAYNCANPCVGGVKKIWLANIDDIDTVTTGVGGVVTAVTMQAGKYFWPYEFKRNTKAFTETTTIGEDGCTITIDQTLVGIAACYSAPAREVLQELAKQSCCGVVVIHEENTGEQWIWGLEDELNARLASAERSSGTALTDPNQVTINIACQTTIDGMAKSFTGTVPVRP